jgi:hypothetical protein
LDGPTLLLPNATSTLLVGLSAKPLLSTVLAADLTDQPEYPTP